MSYAGICAAPAAAIRGGGTRRPEMLYVSMMHVRVMYVGIDLHKHYMQVAVLNGDGNLTEETRINNNADHHSLRRFLDRVPMHTRFVLESSSVWYGVYSHIRGTGYDIILSNPRETKAIAHAKIKTDRKDARTLAELLRANLIPACYVPSDEAMRDRALVRHRRYLAKTRTGLKNKIHAILLMNGIRTKHAKFTKKHVEELRQIGDYRIDSYLDILDGVNRQIRDAEKRIAETVQSSTHRDAQLVATIPGVGYYSALVITSEIGAISRFADSHRLCSYAGLVPSTYSSGGKTRHGSVTKQGSSFLRSILSECVLCHKRIRKDSQLSRFHSRIARKKGNPKATVATASKLLRISYWLIKEQTEYSENIHHDPRSAIKPSSTAVNTLAN